MALIPEFEARIARNNHALQCRTGAIARQISSSCQPPPAWAESGYIPFSDHPAGCTGASRLIVVADPERGGIPDGRSVAATHARSFDRWPQIENSAQHVGNPWAMDQPARNRTVGGHDENAH